MAGRKRGGRGGGRGRGGDRAGQDALDSAQLRASFERRFEGAAVLDACLEKAGSTYTAEEVLEEFAGAAAAGATPDEIFPMLFHEAPAVGDADEARRLFSNLFGAWDAAAGDAPAPALAEVAAGQPLPTELVEASWRATDLLSPADLRSQWDRFTQTQGDVLAYVAGRCRALPDEAFDTAATASFEMWRAFAAARPERVRAGSPDLKQLEGLDPQAGPEPEPALADFAAEALEIAAGEGLTGVEALSETLSVVRRAMAERWG